REGLSVAINRNEMNELIYFGLANPSQAAPVPTSFFYEPWMTTNFAQYDPDLANQLLDEIGLDQRDADGFRMRPDGETFFLNFQVSIPEDAWRRIGQLVADHWNAVGIKTNYKLIEIGLYNELRNGNQVDLASWGLDISDIGEVATRLTNLRQQWGARASGHLRRQWLQSDGENGEEPPQEIKDLWELGEEFLSATYLSDEWIALGKEFYTKTFEGLYQIGTIQRPPQPLLFKTNLKNTPPSESSAKWSWSYRQWVLFLPEQFYFEGDG
ncbi:MAG: hypothetical protein F4X87_11165, partial [Chloroflexi bacterium]|nr:hypothetical protein [Chloroflexota bacterium]